MYKCQNCDYSAETSIDLAPIRDIEARVSSGEPMPAGECPRCGALVQEAIELTVWVASWDVRNSGTGVEVYRTKKAAVDEVMAWIEDHSQLVDDEGDLPGIREKLEVAGHVHFDDRECYYYVNEQLVHG